MKKLLNNLKGSPMTSCIGTGIGLPEIIAGLQSGNWLVAVKGAGIMLWGILTNEHGKK